MHPRRLATLASLLVLPLLLTACGTPTRAKPSNLAEPRPERSAEPTVFPKKSESPSSSPSAASPTATATGTATSSPTAAAGGDTVQATNNNTFAPEKLTVKAGTTVKWTAPAGSFHTVTGGGDGKQDPASPMNSPLGFTNYEVKFDKPGTYPYFCQPHYSVGMVGEIVVT